MYKLIKHRKGYKGLKVVHVDVVQSRNMYGGFECTDLNGTGIYATHGEVICDIEQFENEKDVIDDFYKNATTFEIAKEGDSHKVIVKGHTIKSFCSLKNALDFLNKVSIME